MDARRMGSREAIEQLPYSLRLLSDLERFNLHDIGRFQQTTLDPSFDSRYLPQNCDAVQLPCFWIPKKYLYICTHPAADDADVSCLQWLSDETRFLFPLHPADLAHYTAFLSAVGAERVENVSSCIWAVPTASVRTFLAWPDAEPNRALFIKTSLHSRICGDRRISRRKAALSVGLSALVRDCRARLPTTLSYLFEPLSLVPRSLPDSGVIFRLIPQPIKSGSVIVAPLFSLFGEATGHLPLLLRLVHETGVSLRYVLEEVLCAAFARLWLEMTLHFGLVLESHGQDLMVELSEDLRASGRFYYRDFEGLAVDWELRRHRKLAQPSPMPHEWAWYETYETWGYPYHQMIGQKLRTSLNQYLRYVINPIDVKVRDWRRSGSIEEEFEPDEVTMMFSRHLFRLLREEFGFGDRAEYNIYRNLNRFVIALLKLRKNLLLK